MNSVRYLGVDWGRKRIGLALGDDVTKLASPLATVGTIEELMAMARQEGVGRIVVGAPYALADGRKLPEVFLAFVADLEKAGEWEIFTYDERMSSKAADVLTGGRKGDKGRDEVAAMVILQEYLDSMRN